MADYTHDFDSRYDFQKKGFDNERDDSRPMFYIEKMWNEKTQTMDDVEMVKVQQPNERLNVFGGRVTDVHRARWPRHYEAFKKNDLMPINGTPLAKWPEISANLEFVDAMKAQGLWTVEDMAGMSDIACQKFHGGPTWRKRAQIYLTEQRKIADALAKTNATDQTETIAAMKAQLEALTAQLSAKPEPKKRGPKPKSQEAA